METWKKVYAAAEFVCAGTMTVSAWSNIENLPGWVLIFIFAMSVFATYDGIDALKED